MALEERVASIEMLFSGDAPVYYVAPTNGALFMQRSLVGFAIYLRGEKQKTPAEWMYDFGERWSEGLVAQNIAPKSPESIVFMPERNQITYHLTDLPPNTDLWQKAEINLTNHCGYKIFSYNHKA